LSSYEDCTRKPGNHDEVRESVGSGILVYFFASATIALDLTVVLNAGCGAGRPRRGVWQMVRARRLCYRWPSFSERVVLV
jgi:hypothetical protein